MARFYTNENFPIPAAEELRKLGHDVLTIQETGKANQGLSDTEVLAFAHSEKRILLTLNRKHFIQLDTAQPDHSGIIVCTLDPNFAALSKRIDSAVKTHESIAGKLVRINRPTGSA